MNRTTRTSLAQWGTLLGAWLASCAPAEVPATQLLVTVDGDPSVLARLKRVRASVQSTDPRDGAATETHDFVLEPDDAPAARERPSVPFSFAVLPGTAPRVLLVIEGYDALAPDAAPVIEQKRVAVFAADGALPVQVHLAAPCFALTNPCRDLARTCWPEARACGPVPLVEHTHAAEPFVPNAQPAAPPSGCPVPSPCPADYPCTPTAPTGHVCLGQRAEWPVPIQGSRTTPRYDATDPRIVVDQVTGLVWQRERPVRYEGCSGRQSTPGDLCTADEAKIYCSRLQLADRAWRLPSKAELESLLLHERDAPALDPGAFLTTYLFYEYWSSSLLPRTESAAGSVAPGWTVQFGDASPRLKAPTSLAAVRCVSGLPLGRGTPTEHFRVDPAADTVTDRATGLTWQRTESAPLPTLDDATRYCAARGAGWRLPHVKELLTVLDPIRVDPALDASFPAPKSGLAWAWVPKPSGTEAWQVDALLGTSYPLRFADLRRDARHANAQMPHARCVQSPENVP